MEEYTDEQKKVIRQNTVKELIEKFDKLLMDMISKDKMTDQERSQLIQRIISYADYRIRELRYAEFYDLVDMLYDIKVIDYDKISLKGAEDIFARLKELLPVATRYDYELRRRDKKRKHEELYRAGIKKFREMWSD